MKSKLYMNDIATGGCDFRECLENQRNIKRISSAAGIEFDQWHPDVKELEQK